MIWFILWLIGEFFVITISLSIDFYNNHNWKNGPGYALGVGLLGLVWPLWLPVIIPAFILGNLFKMGKLGKILEVLKS